MNIDLHAHSNLDPEDGLLGRGTVSYTYMQALSVYKSHGVDVVSFTHHNKVIFTKEMEQYAHKLGILLLPGVEATIENSHVVIINPSTDNIRTFAQLRQEKESNPDCFIFAPHPFYPGSISVGFSFFKHIDLFDAIEISHFHQFGFGFFNVIARVVAWMYKKPLIGTSDSHSLETIGKFYTQLDSSLNQKSILSVLKKEQGNLVKSKVPFHYYFSVIFRKERFKKWFSKGF